MPKNTPIDPVADSRVQEQHAIISGTRYHYLLGEPNSETPRATVVLVHGWPDLSFGWRYQIPALLDLGCRVVAPDMMGYGGTDAPKVPPASLDLYSVKRASNDIVALAKQLGAESIILGGHDWGGTVVWRCAAYYPDFVSHVFAVCTPYTPPSKKFLSTETIVKNYLPNFGYQLHLASGEIEQRLTTKDDISAFLRTMYGARTAEGEAAFSPFQGILFDKVHRVQTSALLTEKVLEYYTSQYYRNGLHGPLNWYRTREINHRDEQALIGKSTIDCPCLFIGASRDQVLKPEMTAGMDRLIPKLTMRQVDANHWALWERPDEVNEILEAWLRKVALQGKADL